MSRFQVQKKRIYCCRSCAGKAQAANPALYEAAQRHRDTLNAMNRERFRQGLKARLLAEATAILQPGMTLEQAIWLLYAAEKRGYRRGYVARATSERRRAA